MVDNLYELRRLVDLLAGRAERPGLWLRLRPGIAVDTHAHRQTGQSDSKFGMGPDEIEEAVRVCAETALPLVGLHFHQGSHFHDPTPVSPALAVALDLVASLYRRSSWLAQELCPGGGWGVPYHEDDLPHADVDHYVSFVAGELVRGCRERSLPLPHLQLEPGRSVVARAGVAVYTVGAIKRTSMRRWLLIDGGLADNPRPALYGARYTALPVSDPLRPLSSPVWMGGPYCESGDVLIGDLEFPEVEVGELVAVPVSGAYHLAMSSNYNGALRPAVLWLEDGHIELVRRRESVADLLAQEG